MKNCTRYGHAAASRSDTRFRAQFHANLAENLRRVPTAPTVRGCTMSGSARRCHERRFRDALHKSATAGYAPLTEIGNRGRPAKGAGGRRTGAVPLLACYRSQVSGTGTLGEWPRR
ncbi:hypothetical protein EFE23_02535 [Micromonospora solifontis]|uniref:Uncharacterized protein n=1 Tax=Micromonospora solifontis TaxID=2487138 RepID=A0ABX9WLL0_9ACTN|nr:hypothetical protein EFE23_02535 [Micromonospora solifontis]